MSGAKSIVNPFFLRATLAAAIFLFGLELAHGQGTRPRTTPRSAPSSTARTNQPPQIRPRVSPSPTKPQPMRKAADLISKQPPMATNAPILQK
ncbi:MAG TPA: hypothetical protein VF626_08425, partial [Chthoniobacterales bacterium]